MSRQREVYLHNLREAAKFKNFFRLMPKVITIYAADAALTSVMQPASDNFRRGKGSSPGDKMVHSSSNAAWNWRVSLGSEDGPLYEKSSAIDGSLIGKSREERSANTYNSHYMIAAVIEERRIKDVNKKLFSALFSKPNSPIPNVSLYNNIDRLAGHPRYVEWSNIKSAAKKLDSYAISGVQLAHLVLKSFERSGLGGAPDAAGLLESLRRSSQSKFFTWA